MKGDLVRGELRKTAGGHVCRHQLSSISNSRGYLWAPRERDESDLERGECEDEGGHGVPPINSVQQQL